MIVDVSFLCVSEHIMHGLVYIHVCLIPAFFCVHYVMFVNKSNIGWKCKGSWYK
jgi:hypothetical protein